MTDRDFTVIGIGTLATIHETPDGAPSGVIYQGLMTRFPQLSLNMYITLLIAFKRDGLVTEANNLLYPTKKLDDMMEKANAILIIKG